MAKDLGAGAWPPPNRLIAVQPMHTTRIGYPNRCSEPLDFKYVSFL